MADLTFAEFAESTGAFDVDTTDLVRLAVLERVYDHLRSTGVDISAVVEGRHLCITGEMRQGATCDVCKPPRRGAKPDLSRLRKLEAKWRMELTQQEKVRGRLLGATTKAAMQVHCEAMELRLKELTEALDAIEKGGA